MIEEREELILSQNSNNETPILRKSHFLKPTNPRNQPLPKPPSSSSLLSDYNLNLLQKKVVFNGRPKPQKNWQSWVGKLIKFHESTWKKAGIFDAIRATTYCLMRDNELILGLAGNWCSETNSFLFSWGECSITLEDVMILGGFSVLGECVTTPFENREFEEIENKLVSVFCVDRKISRYQIYQKEWMEYFIDFGGELEHMAFLVLWLSRYVFPAKSYCEISSSAFPIAIALARGTKIALAPAVLAAIYRDLSLLNDRIVSFVYPFDKSNLVLWAPFQLVQLWAWERFPTLCPKPIALFEGEPRVARWQNLRMLKDKIVRMGFESLGESFLWRPYALCLENWRFPEFYSDDERLVLIDSEVGEELLSFAKCLKSCELVGLDCTQQYLPHRVGKQFGLDQDIPSSIPRSNDSVQLAWSTYDIPLDGAKLYLPPRLLQGGVTVQYSDWFMTEFSICYNSMPGFKRQRISSSSQREARFIPSTASDATVEKNSESTPTCLAPLSNVLTVCSVRSVGNMQVEATPSCDKKSHVDTFEEMPSPTPNNELTVTKSHDLDGLTVPNCNRTSCCVSVPSSFVINTEERNIEAATCDLRATPGRSYAENNECLPFQCLKEVKTALSKNFDQTTDLNNLHNVGEMPDETTTCCDDADKRLGTPTPSHNLADNSDHWLSLGSIEEKCNPSQTLNVMEEDNSKVIPPCLPSSLDVVEGSGFADNVGEICIETISSSDNDDHENVPCLSTEIDIEKVIRGLDFVMEQVGAYRAEIMNMSSDRSADCFTVMHTETFPSCNNKGVSPRESHNVGNEASPYLCKQKAVNEAPSHVNTVIEETVKHEKNHEDASCIKLEIANDKHREETQPKCVDVKLLASSYDNPVIVYDDNEDDMENDDLIPFEVMCSGLERRISRLEGVVLRMQAAKLQSNAKTKSLS